MKKVILIGLLLLVATGLVFARGRSSTSSGKIKLIGMCWGATDNQERMTAKLFAAYPELRDKYEIEWVIGGSHDSDVGQKMRMALSSKEYIADFVQLNYTQVPEFADAGVLYDVSKQINQYASELLDGAVNISKYKGKSVVFPFELKPRVWYYRADLFRQAGVDVKRVVTVDDLIDAGKKVQSIAPGTYIWNLGSSTPHYLFNLALSGNGAAFSDANGNYNITSNPGIRAVLTDYKKLIDAGVVMNVSDWTPDWESSLNKGTIVSQLSAGWLAQNIFLPTYAGTGQSGKWAATKWPQLGGSKGGSDSGGSVFAIPTFAKNPEAAADFLSYLTLSKAGTKIIFEEIACVPINKNTLNDPDVKKPNPYFGESLLEAQIAGLNELMVFNYTPKAAAEIDIVNEYFIKAIYGEMSIDAALNAAQNDLNRMLGNALR
ncbi:MAG: extracellular solute-binding protein [Treponema sp.]|nr:extracellular solute-binding protein [Treponema sp.]